MCRILGTSSSIKEEIGEEEEEEESVLRLP
jgi:hypothetical protein